VLEDGDGAVGAFCGQVEPGQADGGHLIGGCEVLKGAFCLGEVLVGECGEAVGAPGVVGRIRSVDGDFGEADGLFGLSVVEGVEPGHLGSESGVACLGDPVSELSVVLSDGADLAKRKFATTELSEDVDHEQSGPDVAGIKCDGLGAVLEGGLEVAAVGAASCEVEEELR